jgi:hypothetical protein
MPRPALRPRSRTQAMGGRHSREEHGQRRNSLRIARATRLRLNWPHSDMMSVAVTTDWRNLVPMAHAGMVWVRPMLEGVQANEGYAGRGTSGTVVAPSGLPLGDDVDRDVQGSTARSVGRGWDPRPAALGGCNHLPAEV